MLLVIGSVLLALYVIPGAWGWALVAAAVALTVGETVLARATQRLPLVTGVEAMIGARAVVISSCRPSGRVRYRGESWKARCAQGAEADVGDEVTIVAVENMTLTIAP